MNPRIQAIQEIRQRPQAVATKRTERASQWFGEQVFSAKVMKSYLPEAVTRKLQETVRKRAILEVELAQPLASAVKAWAMDKGATHYTHWLQPLSGIVAEKHNTFLEVKQGEAIDSFSGEELRQMSPDASSFPLAGGRTTFEARGSMAWDCQSPMFIFETTYGCTLVIPTLFVSYTGETLDHRIPLLKSHRLLETAALKICTLFQKDIQEIVPTLGQEQEYYLVDRSLADLRPDLLLTGRTLIGSSFTHPPQGTDQYFNAIPERVYAFMNELEQEAHRLGIPLKTRHNESSPGQFECASQYEAVAVALDHGLMVMDLIQRVARKHQFTALLHEKPFPQFNGSAKHNNWSLQSGKGENLLAPGTTPKENLRFLVFLVCMIKGLHQHADLLAAMLVSPGNDLRLGSQEAPPPILSIFIGKHLSKVLKDIENPPRRKKHENLTDLELLGISEIPQVLVDNTDRNRTSPIAFTGNRFEFRTVGSSAHCSDLISLVQLIFAQQLTEFHHKVQSKINRSRKPEAAILDVLQENITASKPFLFEGDSQSPDWPHVAKKRGLVSLASTPTAIQAFTLPKNVALLEEQDWFQSKDLHQRQASLQQQYLNKVQVESELLLMLCHTSLLPLALKHWNRLQSAGPVLETQSKQLEHLLKSLGEQLDKFQTLLNRGEQMMDLQRKAETYAELVRPAMEVIQQLTAKLEATLPDAEWPLPKSWELLFVR